MLDMLTTIQTNHTTLEARFNNKLVMNPRLNRQLVSFQANKNKPRYRWFKYKEGFSEALIHYVLDVLKLSHGHILDPFAGVGTSAFVALERGLNATAIELLPVGYETMQIYDTIQRADKHRLREVIHRWIQTTPWHTSPAHIPFEHLKITDGAFSDDTQPLINQYRTALMDEPTDIQQILRFALMCVLEDVSYTRKDGQYLRWDYRSGRTQGRVPFDKGTIPIFDQAIISKLTEIADDLGHVDLFSATTSLGDLTLLQGSCLDILPTLPDNSFDGIITSPPYANRYDYTRTYALELAFLGVDEGKIRQLRQAMLSCTVENRDKQLSQADFSQDIYQQAHFAFENQTELQAILTYLENQKEAKLLNNAGIPRMIRNYFWEMSLLIFECARLLKPNSPFVMVNDNVRYGGVAIPVDLILSDIAQQAGFDVEVIWVLPTGKGNSSQQMGAYGREVLRKCIYVWRWRGI
ncbi:MAG: site-specific DNA-methyltransferase [Anaerolineae bacterium]|nr:site-specific DNA-methyltransferase [Anaerolineae bacterium]